MAIPSPHNHTSPNSRVPSEIDVGISSGLNIFMADTYVLLAKTQGCHWNATGPDFYALHKLTEVLYGELFTAIDTLAERGRAIRGIVPGTLSGMLRIATLEEADGAVTTVEAIRMLATDNMAMAEHARDLAEEADEAEDPATHDLLIQRIAVHEKAAWILRSHLT